MHKTVLSILQADAGHALTFDEVVSGVAATLKDDIRTTLNELADQDQIQRHVGGRDSPRCPRAAHVATLGE
jgi:hypothetical protein